MKWPNEKFIRVRDKSAFYKAGELKFLWNAFLGDRETFVDQKFETDVATYDYKELIFSFCRTTDT